MGQGREFIQVSVTHQIRRLGVAVWAGGARWGGVGGRSSAGEFISVSVTLQVRGRGRVGRDWTGRGGAGRGKAGWRRRQGRGGVWCARFLAPDGKRWRPTNRIRASEGFWLNRRRFDAHLCDSYFPRLACWVLWLGTHSQRCSNQRRAAPSYCGVTPLGLHWAAFVSPQLLWDGRVAGCVSAASSPGVCSQPYPITSKLDPHRGGSSWTGA